ncbi:hypothetical protein HDE_00176 [Halotydeus destructor]|nr:hypothetical protein HDE_00176 [Halotydeus destructor]
MAIPVSDWRTECSLTQDAIDQSKAVIEQMIDGLESAVLDCATGKNNMFLVWLKVQADYVAANSELQKVLEKLETFMKEQPSGNLRVEDKQQIRRDVARVRNIPMQNFIQSYSDMRNHLNDAEIVKPGRRLAEMFRDSKENILKAVDMLYQEMSKLLSAKFEYLNQ